MLFYINLLLDKELLLHTQMQVLQTVGEDKASVKFLQPCSEHSDIFQWPHKDDISIIETTKRKKIPPSQS
jgi:hypothetical protein